MSLPARLLGANPSIQVSTLLSGSLSTPSAKQTFIPPTDYQSLGTLLLSGSATTEFANIPQTFHHLQLRGTLMTGSTASLVVQFNNDTNSNYQRNTNGTQASTGAFNTSRTSTTSNILVGDVNGIYAATNDYYASFVMDIFNYTSTDWYKLTRVHFAHVRENTSTNAQIEIARGAWRSTSAISSIQFSNVNFYSGASSYIGLYGMGIK